MDSQLRTPSSTVDLRTPQLTIIATCLVYVCTKDSQGHMLLNAMDLDTPLNPEYPDAALSEEQAVAAGIAAQSGSFKLFGCVEPDLTLLQHMRLTLPMSPPIRLCFPSVSQNISISSLLPQYINTLGKKIDLADEVKETQQIQSSSTCVSRTVLTCYDSINFGRRKSERTPVIAPKRCLTWLMFPSILPA